MPISVDFCHSYALSVRVAVGQMRGAGVYDTPRLLLIVQQKQGSRLPGLSFGGRADNDIRQAVAVDIPHGNAVGLTASRKPVAHVREAASSIAKEQRVFFLVFNDEKHVHGSIAVEIGGAGMLVIMALAAECSLPEREASRAVVEV